MYTCMGLFVWKWKSVCAVETDSWGECQVRLLYTKARVCCQGQPVVSTDWFEEISTIVLIILHLDKEYQS